MFDPIVYRSKFGDVVEISVHENVVKFSIRKGHGGQNITDTGMSSKPTSGTSHEELVSQMKAKNPTATPEQIEAAVSVQEAKMARTQSSQPNPGTHLGTSFNMEWDDWEKLTVILKALQP